MNEELTLKYGKVHESAQNYNTLIWTVFSIGVDLSLWILFKVWPSKTDFGPMYFIMSILGFMVLFYCILTIESFGQKKSLMYKIFNKEIKGIDLEKKIEKLPFYRVEWIAEIILLIIFSMYVYLFWFVWDNESLKTFGEKIIILAPVVFIFSLILLFIVVVNWILRPKNGDGNPIERTRRFIFGNLLRSYDEIVKGA